MVIYLGRIKPTSNALINIIIFRVVPAVIKIFYGAVFVILEYHIHLMMVNNDPWHILWMQSSGAERLMVCFQNRHNVLKRAVSSMVLIKDLY